MPRQKSFAVTKNALRIPLCLVVLVFTSSLALLGGERARPNIILIFTDDHGWADLGVQSMHKEVRTPHLDQLAADGVRFSRGYVTAPQCSPSRAGLLTGRYQTRFGLEQISDNPLTLNEKTLADRLKQAGYLTGMIGKWHLDSNKEYKLEREGQSSGDAYRPRNRGFDEYFAGSLRHYEASFDLKGNTLADPPQAVSDLRYRVDVQTDAALAFLQRRLARPEQPFFLYLAWFAPHVPMEKPEPYMSRFADVKDERRRMGLAAVAAMDDGVGRLRRFLREHRLEKRTLIFFISDNGAPLRPAAWNGSLNDPFVGEKGMLTDGGIRVPFLAAWNGVLPAGKVYDRPVITLDVAATALAAAGVPVDPALDGVDLVPFLCGEHGGSPHPALFWRWRSQAAVLEDRWKLVFVAPDRWHLFDHHSAVGETRDVATAHPRVVERLRKLLGEFAAAQNPPGLPEVAVSQDQRFFDYLSSTNAVAASKGTETRTHGPASGNKRKQNR
jgi:arylsulfatase A-like enzyme